AEIRTGGVRQLPIAAAPRSGKPPGPCRATRVFGTLPRPNSAPGSIPSPGSRFGVGRGRSIHSRLAVASSGRAEGGAGSPADITPPEGLAERVRNDPTTGTKPPPAGFGTGAEAD